MTLKAIKENGGATLTKSGLNIDWSRGYQVSVQDLAIMPVRELRAKYIKSLLATLERGEALGVWIDKGKAYVDKSVYVRTKREAMRLGKKNKQISIFNWSTKEAVYL